MFQGEEHEIAVRCIQGTYTWLSFVKAQSVRKEVVREEVGEKRGLVVKGLELRTLGLRDP